MQRILESDNRMKKIISFIFFTALAAVLFHLSNVMLFEKQHFGTAKNIAHEEAEKIDVFFVGASHIFFGINPMEIWNTTGISGYNLTTHQQPLWSSKLLLQYALNHQHPRLIVMDVLMATNFGRPLIGTEQGTNMTHLALDPIPLSPQKIKGVMETDSIIEKGEMLFPIILNHSRLQQGLLAYDDFHFFTGRRSHPMKGYNYTESTLWYDHPDIPDPDLLHDLPEGMEEVLIDFIGFCRSKNLPLLFIKTPLIGNEELYGQINYIGKIAEKYDVPFLDFNQLYDELGIDGYVDFADTGHLNVHGAKKISGYLADYLDTHYDLPDHRGDPSYASWEQSSRHFGALTGLPGTQNIMDIISAASDPDLLTVIISGGAMGDPLTIPDEVRGALTELGLQQLPETIGKGAYYAVIKGGKVSAEKFFASGVHTKEFMVRDSRFTVHASSREPDGGSYMTALHIDKGGYFSVEPGMLIVTYDTDRMESVSAVRYAYDKTMSLEHLQ